MVNPEEVRLSEHFLLSDLMGCHSCYVKGFTNVFQDDRKKTKLGEGKCLAENVLERVVGESPVSISYGYISLELARKIITYQSPEKPSYHQWNDGAAADVVMHRIDADDVPPIHFARACDEEFPMSRTITYSESPFICVATRKREVLAGKPRRAFYENQYEGKPKVKPRYITIPEDRESYFEKHALKAEWRGAGYPTYHGGGLRQTHHIRVGRYSMFSDFLYSTTALTVGHKNCPIPTEPWVDKFSFVANVYAEILDALEINHLSIVRAFEHPRWGSDVRHHWVDEFSFDVIPPESVHHDDVADAASDIEGVHTVGASPRLRRVTISGKFPRF